MRIHLEPGAGRAVVASIGLFLFLVSAFPTTSLAQGSRHGRGTTFATPEELKEIKRTPTYRGPLPDRVDLSAQMPIPGDQGDEGSCQSWSSAYTRAYYAGAIEGRSPRNSSNIPSPAYIYRSIVPTPNNRCQSGAAMVDALNVLKFHGSESLAQLPYRAGICGALSPDDVASATDFRISDFSVISKTNAFEPSAASRDFLDNVKGELAQNNPVLLAMRASEAFLDLKAGQIYRYPSTCRDGEDKCGHGIIAVGYDEQKQAFKLLNSWGLDWGDRGYGWIAYETFKTEVMEAYVIRMQPPKPSVATFEAYPKSVVEGQGASLVWNVLHADSLSIDGVGPVTGVSVFVQPAVTTTYTLRAANPQGTTTATVEVAVAPKPKPIPKPVIQSFDASPVKIKKGQSTKLSWVVSGASYVAIDPGIGRVENSSMTVSPATSTVYELTAVNHSGAAQATVRVDVETPDVPVVAAPVCHLSVAPVEIVRGGFVTLSYDARNADAGQIDHGVGKVPVSGNVRLSPAASTTYIASFTGRGGSATCSATVAVRDPPPIIEPKPVIESFTATPRDIKKGQKSALTWSVSGTTSVMLDHGIGAVSDNSVAVSPSDTTVYTLTAANKAGAVTAQATVTVQPQVQPMADLPDVRCGKLAVRRLYGNAQIVEGYVGDDTDLALIRASAPSAEIDVKVRPWPQCEALKTMDKALANPNGPKVSIRRFSSEGLRAGDPLVFDIQTPPYPSYLHLAYIQADGSVVNLIQSYGGSSQPYPSSSKIVLGDPITNGRLFFVKPPYGREMLVVLASKTPIFAEQLPRVETERQFLTELRRTLIAISDAASADRVVSASFDTIVTKSD